MIIYLILFYLILVLFLLKILNKKIVYKNAILYFKEIYYYYKDRKKIMSVINSKYNNYFEVIITIFKILLEKSFFKVHALYKDSYDYLANSDYFFLKFFLKFIHIISIIISLYIYSYFFIYNFFLRNILLFIKKKYFVIIKKIIFILLIFIFGGYIQPFIFIYLVYKNYKLSLYEIDVKYQKRLMKLINFFYKFLIIYYNNIYFFFFKSKKIIRPYTKKLLDSDKKSKKNNGLGRRNFSKMPKIKIPYSSRLSENQLSDLSKRLIKFKNPKLILLKCLNQELFRDFFKLPKGRPALFCRDYFGN